jgi:hypothetical protein
VGLVLHQVRSEPMRTDTPTFVGMPKLLELSPSLDAQQMALWVAAGVVRSTSSGWALEDVEEVLAAQVGAMVADAWLDFSTLWLTYGIKRGFLDDLVKLGLCATRVNAGGQLFCFADILAALRRNPAQHLRRRW